MPSNLRPTTREYVHLVTHDHFRSRDIDGGHTIRSVISENLMLSANFTALCFVEPELLQMEVLHCWNSNFRPCCSCGLDLDSMAFIYELDPISWRYTGFANINFLRQRVRKLSSDRQTDRQTGRETDRRDRNYIPLRGWSITEVESFPRL